MRKLIIIFLALALIGCQRSNTDIFNVDYVLYNETTITAIGLTISNNGNEALVQEIRIWTLIKDGSFFEQSIVSDKPIFPHTSLVDYYNIKMPFRNSDDILKVELYNRKYSPPVFIASKNLTIKEAMDIGLK